MKPSATQKGVWVVSKALTWAPVAQGTRMSFDELFIIYLSACRSFAAAESLSQIYISEVIDEKYPLFLSIVRYPYRLTTNYQELNHDEN